MREHCVSVRSNMASYGRLAVMARSNTLSSIIFALIYLFASCTAQSSASPNAPSSTSPKSELQVPSSTSTAPIQTYTIEVGNGDHKFKPDVTLAKVGDVRLPPCLGNTYMLIFA
jgi:hypothetical protein